MTETAETKSARRPAIQAFDTLAIARPLTDEDKLAPQARGLVDAIAAYDEGVTRSTLLSVLPTHLKTKQTAARIFGWYIHGLIDAGIVVVTKTHDSLKPAPEPKAKAEGEEKPKAKKSKKAAEEQAAAA